MKSGATNNIVEIALKYHRDMGWNVVPVYGTSKTPPEGFELKQYFTRKMTKEEVVALWGLYPDAGIAAITGAISNLFVFDVDAKHGRTLGEFGILPSAVSETQGGGNHVFYKHPGFYVKSSSGALYGKGVDIKGDNSYCILPPTTAEAGSYSWMNEPSSLEDLDDAPDWLIDALKNQNNKPRNTSLSEILKEVPEGRRNDAACVHIGTLLAKSEPSEWQEAWSIIKIWNQQYCKPPEKESVLKNKFDDIAKKELAKRQSKSSPLAKMDSIDSGSGVVLTPPMSMKELSEKDIPPTDWDVEQFIDHGTPNMITAPHQSYKSWILVLMAICIATGKPLFGKFATKKQVVLIVNQEDTEGMLKERVNMMLNGESKDIGIFWHIGKGITLTDEYVQLLIEDAHKIGATVILFDSLVTLHSAEENSSSEMQQVMNQLKKINAAGITVIFNHHHRKKTRGFGAKQEDNGEYLPTLTNPPPPRMGRSHPFAWPARWWRM